MVFIKGIFSVLILEKTSNILFSFENVGSDSEALDRSKFSGFISAIQNFAQEYESDDAHKIEMGNYKILSAKDRVTDIIFALICGKGVKSKKIVPILNQVKNLFINNFTGNLYASEEVKSKITESFRVELEKFLTEDEKVKEFFDGV